jgi:chaperonin GroES
MSFLPLHDRVLIKPMAQEEKTAGGIIIPDSAKEKPMRGEVIATGPGTVDSNGNVHALQVKTGDVVIYTKWSGSELKLDGQDHIIMRESDIMGILK